MKKIMRNNFITVLAVLFLNGCGPSEENLEEQATDIVSLQLLNKCHEFQQTNNTSNVFRLGEYHIAIITTGQLQNLQLNLEVQDGVTLDGACLTRQYNAVGYKYEIMDVEIGRVVKNRKRTQSTIKAKIKTKTVIKEKVNGVELRFLCTPGMQFTKKGFKDIEKKYSDMLPDEKFDLSIVQTTPGIPSEEINIIDIPVEWDVKEKCWVSREELSIKSPEDLNIPAPTWLESAWSKDALKNQLRQKGFEEHGGTFYRAEDIEILNKIDKGLLYIGDSWVDKATYVDTQKLLDAKKKFEEKRTWGNFWELLTVLGTVQKAAPEEQQKIITFFHNTLQADIDDFKKKEDRNELKKLANSIKSNPGYKMLDHALLEKMFKDAEDFIAANEKERLETKQRKEAEERKNAADKADRCKKILDDILNEMEPAKAMKDPLAGVSSLKELRESFCKTAGSQNLKVVELTDRYIAVLSLLTQEPDVTLVRHFRDLRYLAKTCRRCKDGIQICKECRGSKICQRCGGRGGYQTRNFEFGGRGDGLREGYRWVECRRECTACEVPEKCRLCKGKGILISINQCRNQLPLIFKNMQIQVKLFK